MKKIKKLLVGVMLASLAVVMLALASCGKVDKMFDRLAEADSFTYEYVRGSGEKSVNKVDLNNLMYHEIYYDENGNITEEYYSWYDEDNKKYYNASIEANVIIKEEVDKEEFLEEFSSYVDGLNIGANIKWGIEWGIYEEVDDTVVYKNEIGTGESKTTIKTVMKSQDEAFISETTSVTNGKTVITTSKYYNLNTTEISIPENVLAAASAPLASN